MKSLKRKIRAMQKYTRAFQNPDFSIAFRELQCQEALVPVIFQSIEKHDLFVGRIEQLPLGISFEQARGFFFNQKRFNVLVEEDEISSKMQNQIQFLSSFWEIEGTDQKILTILNQEGMFPGTYLKNVKEGLFPVVPSLGVVLDFSELLRLGIHGLQLRIEEVGTRTSHEASEDFHSSMLGALDLLVHTINQYVSYCRNLSDWCHDISYKAELLHVASTLESLVDAPPTTFREALQLLLLYVQISGCRSLGRMDFYLADYLLDDLENQRLTEDEAYNLLESFFTIINTGYPLARGGIVLGGTGCPNRENADLFALYVIKAVLQAKCDLSTIALRIGGGQSPALYDYLSEICSENGKIPLFYRDDVFIPLLSKAFDVSVSQAEQYIPMLLSPYLCQQLHRVNQPDLSLFLDTFVFPRLNKNEQQVSKKSGNSFVKFEEFMKFEEVWDAYSRQVEYFVEALLKQEEIEHKVAGGEASFLYYSILDRRSVAYGRSVVDYSIRCRGKLKGRINRDVKSRRLKVGIAYTKTQPRNGTLRNRIPPRVNNMK